MILNSCLLFLIIQGSLSTLSNALNENEFPEDFLFGAASAAYQIEGAWNESGKGENIWDRFTHKYPEMMLDRSNGDVACDSYHKFREDVTLLKEMNVSFYRFSLSWSRILPTGFAYKINPDGIRYYNQLIDLLIENNITPMVTLYHWDLPQPLQDLGGFTNEMIVNWFEEYAKVAFEHFGGRVKLWLTFNEPLQVCHQGYGTDEKAPGYNSQGIGEYICAHNLLKAHARAYHLYTNNYKPFQNGVISITVDSGWYHPKTESEEDEEAAERMRLFNFGWYAGPIFSQNGDYPQVMKDRIAKRSQDEGFSKSRLPEFTPEEIESIQGTYDFMGLNHYTTILVENNEYEVNEPSFLKDAGGSTSQDPLWPGSASSWLKVVPWGYTELLKWIKHTYGDVDIYLTENGYSSDDDIVDLGRVNYYEEYLSAVLDAIYEHQVKVKAYTAWTLLDNFEWREGYRSRFGLHHVDFQDPDRKRTPKSSAEYYKKIIAQRKLVSD